MLEHLTKLFRPEMRQPAVTRRRARAQAAAWSLVGCFAVAGTDFAAGQSMGLGPQVVDWSQCSVLDGSTLHDSEHETMPLIRPQWQSNRRAGHMLDRNQLDDESEFVARRSDLDRPEELPAGEGGETVERPAANDASGETAATNDAPSKDNAKASGKDAIVWRPTRFCSPWGPEQGEVPYDPSAFAPDPDYSDWQYRPEVEKSPWADKLPLTTQRPWVELGRGLYREGRIPPSETWMGCNNLVAQHFLLYGDFRSGLAYIDAGGHDQVVWANRLNLDLDWKITATERVHAFIGPLDRGTSVTRVVLDQGEVELIDELDKNFDTGFFEGDLGAILGGVAGYDSPFDLPFTVGLIPLLFQNGVWMEDALVGAAMTLPARHNAALNWPNFDVTFFAAIDRLNSPAFGTDDSAAHVYGVHWFLEAYGGYFEVGYAALDDQTNAGLGYHNIGASFTRRYFQRISNSVRVIFNTGQDPVTGPKTADGQLVLIENALITSSPNTFVPYCNLFGGFGRPQSVGRAAVSGGVLRNTGILFETDGLTGFPFLDDTANNTYGGAIGVNWLGPNLDRQILLELATVQTFGRRGGRRASDDQFGLGARYQKNLNHAWLFRADVLYGFLEGERDLVGVRTELRHKF